MANVEKFKALANAAGLDGESIVNKILGNAHLPVYVNPFDANVSEQDVVASFAIWSDTEEGTKFWVTVDNTITSYLSNKGE